MKKNECGHYVYKGRSIYRTTTVRGAYNPWKIMLGRTFPTLKAAKAYIDQKEREHESHCTPAPEQVGIPGVHHSAD